MSSNQPYQPDPRVPEYEQPTMQDNRAAYNRTVENNAGAAYAQSQRESYVDPAGNQVETQVEYAEDKNLKRANARYWVTTVTYFILGVLEVIMLLRLIFRLLGANQDNSFITFLYGLSHIFVGPFNGIFNDQAIGRAGVFETSTLVAMLVYALIAWGIVSLGKVMFAPVVSGTQSTTMTRRRR